MKNISKFQQVYPFATEMVSSYLELLDLDGKTVFTVGSSLDQAFNALVLGAKEITVFDVNKNTEEFYKRKREIISYFSYIIILLFGSLLLQQSFLLSFRFLHQLQNVPY